MTVEPATGIPTAPVPRPPGEARVDVDHPRLVWIRGHDAPIFVPDEGIASRLAVAWNVMTCPVHDREAAARDILEFHLFRDPDTTFDMVDARHVERLAAARLVTEAWVHLDAARQAARQAVQ